MPFREPTVGGFLPTHDTREAPVDPDFWTSVDMAIYQAIPDWPIFQTDVLAGLAIGCIAMVWVHYKTRSKPISQERRRLR